MAVRMKKNSINVTMEGYTFYLMGLFKSGKTSLFFEVMTRLYKNTDAGLLVPFEKGYAALSDLKYITCDDDEGNQKPFIDTWEDLEEIVDTLVEDRFTDFKSVKVLGFDTIDRLYALAENEVLSMHKRLFPSKPVKSINDALGGLMSLIA